MKVLVLTGAESTGKSWLAARLQQRFGGVVVGEYVRHFIDQERRDTCLDDIPAIARGQLAWEDAARGRAPELLILDTHLLSNMIWSQTLFGNCPAWLEDELLARRYDHHLLLSPSGMPTASAANPRLNNVGVSMRPAAAGSSTTVSLSWKSLGTGSAASSRRLLRSRRYWSGEAQTARASEAAVIFQLL